MPVVANREGMNLFGKTYRRQQEVPADVVSAIPEHRRGALFRTRLLLEVDTVPEIDGMCPHCGEGPFTRLQRHITAKHVEVTLDSDPEPQVDVSDEPVEPATPETTEDSD